MGRIVKVRDGITTNVDVPDSYAHPTLPTSGTGIPSGTGFPSSPVAGQRFYRTDLKREYTHDGTRWLSSNLIPIQIGVQAATGASADGNHGRAAIPFYGVHSLWIESIDFASYLSVAAQWSINVNYVTAANASVLIATRSLNSDPGAAWTTVQVPVNAALHADARVLEVVFDEVTGTSTMFGNVTIWARIVG